MKQKRLFFLAVSLTLLAMTALAQKPAYPPEMPGSRTEVYRATESVELRAWIFEPPGHSADDSRPAIVFFFGGGWNGGTPGQFRPHAMYLARWPLLHWQPVLYLQRRPASSALLLP